MYKAATDAEAKFGVSGRIKGLSKAPPYLARASSGDWARSKGVLITRWRFSTLREEKGHATRRAIQVSENSP
jgi:hypothetical protein